MHWSTNRSASERGPSAPGSCRFVAGLSLRFAIRA